MFFLVEGCLIFASPLDPFVSNSLIIIVKGNKFNFLSKDHLMNSFSHEFEPSAAAAEQNKKWRG